MHVRNFMELAHLYITYTRHVVEILETIIDKCVELKQCIDSSQSESSVQHSRKRCRRPCVQLNRIGMTQPGFYKLQGDYFRGYYRVSWNTFQVILTRISPMIDKADVFSSRGRITSEIRLACVLRWLAGDHIWM